MNHKFKRATALLCAALCVTLSACASSAQQETVNAAQAVVIPLVDAPDPAMALSKIYENIGVPEVHYAADSDLKERFMIDTALLEDYEVNYTTGRYGLANVFILKPVSDNMVKVRDALENVKLSCIKDYSHYDIYNASQIAQDATIFEQNGYIIMLMVENQEEARMIIDQYIPKT